MQRNIGYTYAVISTLALSLLTACTTGIVRWRRGLSYGRLVKKMPQLLVSNWGKLGNLRPRQYLRLGLYGLAALLVCSAANHFGQLPFNKNYTA